MRMSWLPKGLVVLTGLALLSAQFIAGCGDEQHETGTVVKDTPEAQAGRKASMDGMKSIMEQKGQPKGAESSK
jgi:hypothetical protein